METRFVQQGAPSGALVTLAAIKARLGVTDASRDAELTSWVDTIAAQLEAYTNNCLLPRAITETIHREYSGPYVVLSFATSNSLASLTIDGAAVSLSDYLMYSGGVLARADGATLPDGSIVAEYAAGYDPIPSELTEAALECAAAREAAKTAPVGVARESVPDVGDVTYVALGDGLAKGPTGATLPWAAAALVSKLKRTYAP